LAFTELALEATLSNCLPFLSGYGSQLLGNTGCLGMDLPASCLQNWNVVAA